MSRTIDERVVSMQFDNKNFESNVKTTMSTLDKLKRALRLDDASKGLENISSAAKNVDVSSIGEGVEKVKLKFSALEVMAVTALTNITNSAVNAGKNLVKSLSIDQITAGWNKYEEKTASVQTIMNSTGMTIDEVNRVLEQLMWFSDETSYGFNDMTAALAQMTSSGGDVKKLIPLITGVANATAFAGKGANEFSRAMFNLNQSYGAGYLQLMDWRSLELAGVAGKDLKQTFIDVAEELGKIEKGTVNIGNFSETLKDKWADTEVMEKAFGRFSQLSEEAYKLVDSGQYDTAAEAIEALSGKYDNLAERAFKSAQEAKSFTEAIDATKDAVSSGWMRTFEIIFGNYEQAKVLWTDLANTLWDVFASGAEKRNNVLEEAFGSKWDEFAKQINEAGIETENFEAKLTESLRNAGIPIDDLIEQFGSLSEALKHVDKNVVKSHITKVLKEFSEDAKGFTDTSEKVTESLEHYQEIVNKVIKGDFGSGKERIDALTKAGENQAVVQKLVNAVWEKNGKTWKDTTITADDLTKAIADLSESELVSIGYTEEQAAKLKELADQAEKTGTPINELIESLYKPSGRELLIDSFKNIYASISQIVGSIKDAWGEVFDPVNSNGVYKLIESFHDFTSSLKMTDERVDQLKRTFKGLFAILKTVKKVFTAVFGSGLQIAWSVFKALGKIILSVTSELGDLISQTSGVSKVFKPLSKVVSFVTSVIDKFGEKVSGLISKVLKPLVSKLSDFKSRIGSFASTISKKFGGITKTISDSTSKWKEKFDGVTSTISGAISKWKEKFEETTFFKTCSEHFENGIQAIKDALDKLESFMEDFDFTPITEKLQAVGDFFVEIGKKIGKSEIVKTVAENIGKAFSNVYKSIKNFKLPKFDMDKFVTKFSNFSDRLSKIMQKNNLSGVKGGIVGFFKALSESFSSKHIKKLKNIPNKVLSAFSDFYLKHGDTIKAGFEKCKEVLSSLIEFVVGSEKLSLPAILSLVEKILAIKLLLKALSIVDGITGTFESIGGAFENIAKSQKWKAIGDAFKAMALALIAFTGCIVVLNGMGDTKKTLASAGILAGLLAVMGGIIAALMLLAGKINGSFNMAAVVLSILGMAISLSILVGVLKDIDATEFKNVKRSWAIMTGVLISMAVSMALIGKFCKGGVPSVIALVTMLTALKMVLEILKDYAAYDWAAVQDAIPKMMAMLLGLAFALRVASGGVKSGANTSGLAFLMLSLVVSMKILIGVIEQLAEMDSKKMWQGILGMTAVLGAITVMLAVINSTNKGGVLQKGQKSINGFAGLATALIAVAATIWILGSMDTNKLLKGGAAVVTILGMFTIMLAAMGKACSGNFKMSALITMLIGFGVLLAEMGIVVKSLSSVGWANAIGSAGALSLLLLSMAGCMMILTKNGKAKASNIYKWIGAMAVMSLVVAELAGVLGLMSVMGVDGGAAIGQVAALSLLLLSMAGCMMILMKHSRIKAENIYKWIGAMAVMALVAAEVSGVLGLLKVMQIDGGEAIGQVAALLTLLLAMSVCVGICAAIGKKAEAAYPAMGALAVFAAGLVAFLSILGGIDAIFKGGFADVMDRAVVIMGKIGEAIGAFIGGIAKGVLEGVSSSLPKLGSDLGAFMTNAQPFFDGIANIDAGTVAKAGFLASVIGAMEVLGAANGFANFLTIGRSLPNLGRDLGAFMTNAQPFFAGLISVPEESTTAANTLAKTILALSEASLLEGITKMLTFGNGGLAKFGDSVVAFGDCLMRYSASVSGLTDDDLVRVSTSAEAGKLLSEMAKNIPNDGGAAGWLFGDNNIGTFGESIVKFGEGLVNYAASVSVLTEDDITKISMSASAGTELSKMAKTIPNDGGAAGWLFGENNIGTFGESIVKFGEGLVNYAETVRGLTEEDTAAIKNSAESGSLLADLANSIPNEGGQVAWLFGDNSLTTFGTSIVAFGEGLMTYAETVRDLTPEDTASIQNSKTAAEALVEVANAIPNDKGLWGKIVGDQNVSAFGTGMADLARGLKNYTKVANEIEDEDVESIKRSKSAVEALVDVADAVPTEGSMWEAFTGSADLSGFSKGAADLGRGLKSYINSVSDITDDDIAAVVRSEGAIKAVASAAKSLPNEGGMVSWFTGENSIDSFVEPMKRLGRGIISYINTVKNISDDDIKAVGRSKKAIKAVASAAKAIPNEGGLAGMLFGENSIEKFSSEIISLAKGITKYISVAKTIDDDSIKAIERSADAVDEIAKAAENIPETLGSAESALGLAAHYLNELVDALVKAATIDTSGVSKINESLTKLGSLSVDGFVTAITNAYPKVAQAVSGMFSAFTAAAQSHMGQLRSAFSSIMPSIASSLGNNQAAFVNAGRMLMTSMANGIRSGASIVISTIRSTMTTCASSANSGQTVFANAGRMLMVGMVNGVRSGASAVTSTVSSIMTTLITLIRSRNGQFSSIGKMLIQSFIKGVRSAAAGAKTAVSTMASDCTSALNDKYSGFYNAGGYVVEGFAAGIDENTFKAEAKAKAMAEAALEAAREALDINSPSKAFRKLAYSIPEGFAQGIDRRTWMAEESSKDMANGAIESASDILARMKETIQGKIDTQPVIRPVVDMSSAKGETLQLRANINTTLTKPVNSLSKLVTDAQADINASNNEVITAINGLRNDLAALYSADDQEIALYVDSKKLASSLAKPMNRQLNILSKRGAY